MLENFVELSDDALELHLVPGAVRNTSTDGHEGVFLEQGRQYCVQKRIDRTAMPTETEEGSSGVGLGSSKYALLELHKGLHEFVDIRVNDHCDIFIFEF